MAEGLKEEIRLGTPTVQVDMNSLDGLGMTFIRLFSHAIAHRLVDEADALVAGIGVLYPSLDLREMRVNVFFARCDYVEAESLLKETGDPWSSPWRALLAKRRNDATWRELAEEANAAGTTWATPFLQHPPNEA